MVPSILIVDDEKHSREGLREALADTYDVSLAANADEAFNLMEAQPFEVILTDLRMPGKSGLKVIDRALALPNKPAVLMMTAYGNIETAVEAMKRGAVDFLTKPVNIERLEVLIQRALKTRTLEVEVKQLHERLDEKFSFDHIIGHSMALKTVIDQVKLVAPSRATILIEGESGSGKELIAQAIHQVSPRTRAPFIAVHCAALSESLLESEIFGHEKGSFTGATERRVGRFESADGGTLFLDEVGEIPPDLQAKLLRVLQEGQFEKVGEDKTRSANVRVIAATNRDLEAEAKAGRFRLDLYYRLSVFPIELPPLRERREDIAPLAEHFVAQSAQRLGIAAPRLAPTHARELTAYDWPGNVRELQNVVERAVILARNGPLRFELGRNGGGVRAAEARGRGVAGTPVSLSDLKHQERSLIEQALEQAKGKIYGDDGAAALLGLKPTTLASKIQKLGLRKG